MDFGQHTFDVHNTWMQTGNAQDIHTAWLEYDQTAVHRTTDYSIDDKRNPERPII